MSEQAEAERPKELRGLAHRLREHAATTQIAGYADMMIRAASELELRAHDMEKASDGPLCGDPLCSCHAARTSPSPSQV